jgi:hypothetical protein
MPSHSSPPDGRAVEACRDGRSGAVVLGHRAVDAYSLNQHYLRAGQRYESLTTLTLSVD